MCVRVCVCVCACVCVCVCVCVCMRAPTSPQHVFYILHSSIMAPILPVMSVLHLFWLVQIIWYIGCSVVECTGTGCV